MKILLIWRQSTNLHKIWCFAFVVFRLNCAFSIPTSFNQGRWESNRELHNPARVGSWLIWNCFSLQRQVNWTRTCCENCQLQKEKGKVDDGNGNWHFGKFKSFYNYSSLRCFWLWKQTLLLHGIVRNLRDYDLIDEFNCFFVVKEYKAVNFLRELLMKTSFWLSERALVSWSRYARQWNICTAEKLFISTWR